MEMPFNELEQQVLKFLKQEFLEKGSMPKTMRDPATMDRDVMEKFNLDIAQYRELIARLEHRGVVRGIATGAANGHLQIDPVVVEIVRQLNERAAQPKVQPNLMEQAKQYFFRKRWFIGLIIGFIILSTVAAAISNFKTILEFLSTWQ